MAHLRPALTHLEHDTYIFRNNPCLLYPKWRPQAALVAARQGGYADRCRAHQTMPIPLPEAHTLADVDFTSTMPIKADEEYKYDTLNMYSPHERNNS